jgi:hypothetical protein
MRCSRRSIAQPAAEGADTREQQPEVFALVARCKGASPRDARAALEAATIVNSLSVRWSENMKTTSLDLKDFFSAPSVSMLSARSTTIDVIADWQFATVVQYL